MIEGVSTGLRFTFWPVLAAGVGAVAAASGVLWVHYGGAVFFEMIATGFRTCF